MTLVNDLRTEVEAVRSRNDQLLERIAQIEAKQLAFEMNARVVERPTIPPPPGIPPPPSMPAVQRRVTFAPIQQVRFFLHVGILKSGGDLVI